MTHRTLLVLALVVPLTVAFTLIPPVGVQRKSTLASFVPPPSLKQNNAATLSSSARFMEQNGETTTSNNNTPVGIPLGSVVTVDITLEPEGDFVPETLFDSSGEISFVLGGGNYLPGLHDIIQQQPSSSMEDGDSAGWSTVKKSIDAGWGARNPDLEATIFHADMEGQLDVSLLQIGTELELSNGLKCVVTNLSDDSFAIDANPPLAGASYFLTATLKAVEEGPTEFSDLPQQGSRTVDGSRSSSKYQVATFALGCFWGGELDFMRQPGVVGTKVGFTQGQVDNPEYKQVCSGTTGHTEAIMVAYNPEVVSYEKLAQSAMDRLGESRYLLNQVANDRGTQYRHGLYYHNDAQKVAAERIVKGYGDDCVTEVLPASTFWNAEEYHQQYLLKGGQSAQKGEDSTIRCYG